MEFGLIVRAYAPFKSFGIPHFHGDGRGPTTSPDVTARIKAWVEFDPSTGKVGHPRAKSDESILSMYPSYRATALPTVRIDSVKLGPNWLHFRLRAAGANPLLRGAPDIDMQLAMTASVGKGHLNINAELTGDQFPNSEVILQDQVGTRRMLQSYETNGGRHTGPIVRLPGDRRAPMSAICASLPVDSQGHFQ